MQVKISSEEAGAIALTPVVVREMPVRELVELMLGVTGKDAARIKDLLRRGSFVSGASRFRWAGVDLDVEQLLGDFPDADPSRAFAPNRCTSAVLRKTPAKVEFTKEAATKTRLFQKETFWNLLLATATAPQYLEYSYKEKADVYRARLDIVASKQLCEGAKLLAYSVLAAQVQAVVPDTVDFYLPRE